MERKEFVRVSGALYWLDSPEGVEAAQNALLAAGEKSTEI